MPPVDAEDAEKTRRARLDEALDLESCEWNWAAVSVAVALVAGRRLAA